MPWKIEFLILYNECVSLLKKGRLSTIVTKGRHFYCVLRLHFDCRLPAAYFAFHWSLEGGRQKWQPESRDFPSTSKWHTEAREINRWLTNALLLEDEGGIANSQTRNWHLGGLNQPATALLLHNRYCFLDLKCLGKGLLSFESSVCENPQPSVGWKHSSTKKQCSDTNWEEVLASRYLIKALRGKAFMSTFTSACFPLAGGCFNCVSLQRHSLPSWPSLRSCSSWRFTLLHAVSCGFETLPHAVTFLILSIWLLALISKIKIGWQQEALMKSEEVIC